MECFVYPSSNKIKQINRCFAGANRNEIEMGYADTGLKRNLEQE